MTNLLIRLVLAEIEQKIHEEHVELQNAALFSGRQSENKRPGYRKS